MSYMKKPNHKYSFDDLVRIIATLRSENGCPWDRAQTLKTLKKYLIEEAFEALDAIEHDDMQSLKEELGDVMLLVVLLSDIAKEKKHFDIEDVLTGICQKMIHRHPHVFADAKCQTPQDVLKQWQRLKRLEGKDDGVYAGIPKALPALMQAEKVQSRASKVGFDWQNALEALSKIKEELTELEAAIKAGDETATASEIGDLLFAVVNVSRLSKVSAEDALKQSVNKFASRYSYMQAKAKEANKELADMTLAELDALWHEAKSKEL